MHQPISLTRYILQAQGLDPEVTREFSLVMSQVALAGKMIAQSLRQSGLIDILGSTGQTNVQGEDVQKLDEKANEIFLGAFEYSEVVKTLISEEMEKPVVIASAQRSGGEYALFFDPLDGSSNIDVDASLGSIFSIHSSSSSHADRSEQALLKPGSQQVAAGYILYGPSVNLIYTSGHGVHQFVLDGGIGEFLLTDEKITMPSRGSIYSVNEGNRRKWTSGLQRYVDYLQEPDSATGRPYSSRYTGCFAADVHRIVLKGGVYLYPAEIHKPDGKLRLMYEAAPLTYIVEQAGGLGSTGAQRIQTIQPTALHQRVPLVIGSREDVEMAEKFMAEQV